MVVERRRDIIQQFRRAGIQPEHVHLGGVGVDDVFPRAGKNHVGKFVRHHGHDAQKVLKPRHRLVSKRISRVLLWVDDRDFLPKAMRHEQADGDFTYLEFSDLQINQTLDAGTFTLELPDDVQVKDEISIFKNNHSNGSSR